MKKLGSFLLGLFIAAGSMVLGQVPISGLPPANLPLTGAEKVVMTQTQNGRPVTVQATVAGISPITVVPVQAIQGGTGEAGTITGVPFANGTAAFTAATSAQITPGAAFTAGGATVGTPTGGNQGAGTLNMVGCFVNGVACSVSGGSVTSISAGTGLTLTPNPIVTTGSVALTTPVSVANGGSGTASPALVAGTNVTITGSWPNQTINSTAVTPGGSNTNVQFNNTGAFGGSSDFTWNGSTLSIRNTGAGGGTLTAGAANTVTSAGQVLTLLGGAGGATSGGGGSVNLNGGTPISGNGGGVALTASSAAGASGNGGTVQLNAGSGVGSSSNGQILLNGSTSTSTQAGGSIQIIGGTGASGGTAGGQVTINGGTGTGSSAGANVNVQGGVAPATGNGGDVNITARAGGSTSGNGGNVNITAGSVTSGTLGTISLLGGQGVVAGAPTGGAQGVGTINMTGCFVNGVACSTGTSGVTSISAGTGITLTPNPIVATGTVALTTPVSVANGGTGTASPGEVAGTGITLSGSFPTKTISLTTPVAVANGGSGTATPALVAGTNVTITGSWPNQTINSTASGPSTLSFELTSAGGAVAPTITYCNRCSSPSISRSSAGVWSLTPGITLTGIWATTCTEINTGNTGYYLQAGSTSSGGTTISIGINTISGTTLTPTDPVASVGFNCIASN